MLRSLRQASPGARLHQLCDPPDTGINEAQYASTWSFRILGEDEEVRGAPVHPPSMVLYRDVRCLPWHRTLQSPTLRAEYVRTRDGGPRHRVARLEPSPYKFRTKGKTLSGGAERVSEWQGW